MTKERLVTITVKAPGTHIAMYQFPRPESWQDIPNPVPGGPVLVGASGVKLYYEARTFSFARNPLFRWTNKISGVQQRRFKSVEDLITTDVAPAAAQRGMAIAHVVEVPGVAWAKARLLDLLWQAAPTKNTFYGIGIDMRDKNGARSFALLDVTVREDADTQTWDYELRWLEAWPSAFEEAKEALIFAETNKQYNHAFFAQYNAHEKARIAQSWEEHGYRMANHQAAATAWNNARAGDEEFVNDAIMGDFQGNDAAFDRMHERMTEAIRDEQIVRSDTGQAYSVDAGSEHYWVNQHGEYIQTDDSLYNPNHDAQRYDSDWIKAKPE